MGVKRWEIGRGVWGVGEALELMLGVGPEPQP